MNEVAFVEKREVDWKRFTVLCDKADASPAYLSPKDFHEFVRLYRRISGDLALARTRSSNLQLIDFLNDLTARGYGILYRSPRKPFGAAIGGAIDLAAHTVRRCRWFVLASVMTFLGGAAFAYVLMSAVPSAREQLVPSQFKDSFEGWKQGKFEEHNAAAAAGMTGFYAINNPLVAAGAGAKAAATFGIGTAEELFNNGLVLGTLTYEMATVGKAGFLISSISPHGVPEISGLIIASAAGYVMGWALINPGRRKRSESLRIAGKDAIVLLAVGVMMMFIAAPIEGFFSFNPHVWQPLKGMVAVTELIFWGVFWTGYGRAREPVAPAS